MEKLGTNVYRRTLERMLGRGDDVAVLRLVWAVYALQSGEGPRARQHIVHPPSAERARLGDPEYVYPWNLGKRVVRPRTMLLAQSADLLAASNSRA